MMDDGGSNPLGIRRKSGTGWKYMARWERKLFHRENDSRVRNGLAPLPKPESKPYCGGI